MIIDKDGKLIHNLIMNKKLDSHKQGFIFKRIMFISVCLAIFFSIVLAGILYFFNPKEQVNRLRAERKIKRTADVKKILGAINSYSKDNKGKLLPGLTAGMPEIQIGTASMDCSISTGGCSVMTASCLDASSFLKKYLSPMPIDPDGGTDKTTKYAIGVDQQGVVTVKACASDRLDPVSATR